MKFAFPLIALLAMSAALWPAQASASDESVELSMEAEAASGTLYREVVAPVRAKLHIAVKVPELATKVTPMINSRVTFPAEMSFYPNPKRTPVCPESKVGPQASLAIGVAGIVDLCPKSVIGTGTARMHLAGQKAGVLDDPVLVIFNAGENEQGRPKITIYAFSKAVSTGVIMSGFLDRSGELDIAIGVLPFDSAIGDFTLGIPGDPLEIEDDESPGGTRTVVGLDPGYLRATCAANEWNATGKFVFATRNDSTGELTSPAVEVDSNPFTLPCVGAAGRPKLAPVGIKGKRSFRPGSKQTYRVLVRNTGTATAKGLVLKVSGGGKGTTRIGALRPAQARTVAVKVKFPKAGSARRTLRFKVDSPKVSSAKAITVRRAG